MSNFKYVTSSIEGLNFCTLLSSLYVIAIPEPNPTFLSSQISPGSQWEVFRCIAMDYKAESFWRNRGPTIFKLKTSHLKSDLCALSQPEAQKESIHLYLSSNTEWNKHCIPIKENIFLTKQEMFKPFCTFLSVGCLFILINAAKQLLQDAACGISFWEKHSSLIRPSIFPPL